ncbi:hypothetical protein ACFX19_016896 [Malus domestica]
MIVRTRHKQSGVDRIPHGGGHRILMPVLVLLIHHKQALVPRDSSAASVIGPALDIEHGSGSIGGAG